jgi:hypothetical protein
MAYDKNVSPVGWYIASYMLRFIELKDDFNEDPEHRFTAWENTVIVKASSLEEAYDKALVIAKSETTPYKGGPQGVPVQWVFEGITMLLPIYEALEDGAEIIWQEHKATKLKNLRKLIRNRDEVCQQATAPNPSFNGTPDGAR